MAEETGLTRRERRLMKKEEREKQGLNTRRSKIITRVAFWILCLAVIGLVGYFLASHSGEVASTRPGEAVVIQGEQHINQGASHPPYNSNPPTSGWHYAQAAGWGVYDHELPDEQVIHNLEHGGIWISYKDIDAATVSSIEEMGRQYPGSVVVSPRNANDSKIAVVSWGRLMKLGSFEKTNIEEFIKKNKNNSPEPLAR